MPEHAQGGRRDEKDVPLQIGDRDVVGRGLEDGAVQLLALVQRRLCRRTLSVVAFPLGHVGEDGNEVAGLGTEDGEVQPQAERREVELGLGRLATLDHAPVEVEELGRLVSDAGDDLGDALAHHVLEAGEPLERRVDREVDEVVGPPGVVVEHAAVGAALEHVLDDEREPLLALVSPGQLAQPGPLPRERLRRLYGSELPRKCRNLGRIGDPVWLRARMPVTERLIQRGMGGHELVQARIGQGATHPSLRADDGQAAALELAVVRYLDQSAQGVGVDVGDAAEVDHHPGRLLVEEGEQPLPESVAAGTSTSPLA